MKTDNEYLKKIANDINVIKWVLIWPFVLGGIFLAFVFVGWLLTFMS